MEKTKKYLLIFAIALSSFLLITDNTNAIDYGTGGAFSIPNIYLSGGSIIGSGETFYEGRDSVWYAKQDGNNYYYKSLVCFPLFNNTSSGIYDINSSGGGFHLFFSGTQLNQSIHDMETGLENTGTIIDFAGLTSGGVYQDDFTVCINFSFVIHYPFDPGSWLYSRNIFIYNTNEGNILNQHTFFTGSSAIGFKFTNDPGFSPQYNYGAWRYHFTPFDGVSLPDNVGSDNRQIYLSQFLTGVTISTNDILYPAGWFYGSNGVVETLPNPTGTGGVSFGDYFDYSSCTSFLDIGCYVMQTMSGLWDWIWSFFPEISFSGSSNTCMSGATSSLSGNVSYLQKLVNFSLILIPIAPPDGTIVCTIGGMTGTVSYQSSIPSQYRHNMPNNLSIIDIMLMTLIAFALYNFIRHHHTGGSKEQSIVYPSKDRNGKIY